MNALAPNQETGQILLTGATGFLGSRLLESLLVEGHQVIAVKRTSSSTSRIEKLLGHPALQLFNVDHEDPAALYARSRVDTVIHTATEYGRGETPLYSILDANLILPLRLAEVGIKWGVRCFINTDSFFNKAGNSYSNLLNYSLSKKSLLIWLDKLAANLKVINVVLEHIYGPCDSGAKFVESVIQRVGVRKEPYIALTHGHQRRDFVFIDDVVTAYLALVDFGRQNDFLFESFDLGTGEAMQVRDFVESVKDLSGSNTELGFGDIPYRADEIMHSAADISRMQRLGWSPKVSVRAGIKSILDAYTTC
jgi:nucleoside-diphosphate-sugar epimerase